MVSSADVTTHERDARLPLRPGRAAGFVARPQLAFCGRRTFEGANTPLRRCTGERGVPGVRGTLPQMDARTRRAELDRRERGNRSRLSLVLRLEDVRYMRAAHERSRGACLLGGGRAGHGRSSPCAICRSCAISSSTARLTRQKVASLEPWLERDTPYPQFPEPLTHADMKNASKALDCISCMCCYSACPVIGLGDLTDFAGPAPLVQLGQTALDPRNGSGKVARSLAQTGIFNCVSCYKCEEVCPAGHSHRQHGYRAAEGQGRRAASGHGEALAGAARRRRCARPRRPRRAGPARARAARAGAISRASFVSGFAAR